MKSSPDNVSELIRVLYVHRENAKHLKNMLEERGLINKEFRMAPGQADGFTDCIAIPVLDHCQSESFCDPFVKGYGNQLCRYSTAVLGNNCIRSKLISANGSVKATFSPVEKSLFLAIKALSSSLEKTKEDALVQQIQSLGSIVCPPKLEILGDDKTLVIPRLSFTFQDDGFRALVASYCSEAFQQGDFFLILWEQLAIVHNSPRVVRKNVVDPSSPVRESGCHVLWPASNDPSAPTKGWITVTENGIKQSFDLTRTMFSRGNITEKIRFGKLVRPGETVLDMYAGIGYYTLPSLVHGKAGHVYACEWNEYAVSSLRFNLRQNGVADRATVLVGDSRIEVANHGLLNKVDRVCLGLLPSSEGGWRTAIRALNCSGLGGWLHVHGNVKVEEKNIWAKWLCLRLLNLIQEEKKPNNWFVVCVHTEKVKSFAPTVNHYVADICIGSPSSIPGTMETQPSNRAGVLDAQGCFVSCPSESDQPSCALSMDGVIHQDWMMEPKR